MLAHSDKLPRADVVAMFENQDDADEAVFQLRLAGVSDDHLGYFAQHPVRGLMDLIAHDRRFSGSVIGGVAGAALGVWAAQVVNGWGAAYDALRDFFGLAVTLGTTGALFVGFAGWWIGTGVARREVRLPAIDPAIGAFIVAVVAGGLRDRVWALIRRHGGHELPPGATTGQPIAV
jgi:hypothetical protein